MNRRHAIAASLGLIFAGLVDAVACQIDVDTISFGVLHDLDHRDADAEGAVTVTCAEAGNVRVSIGRGLAPGADGSLRLKGPGQGLDYRVYIDPARTQVWGDGLAGTHDLIAPVGIPLGIYARVPRGQQPLPGEYADSLEITIEW